MSLSSHLTFSFTNALGLSFFFSSKFIFKKAPVNLVFFYFVCESCIFLWNLKKLNINVRFVTMLFFSWSCNPLSFRDTRIVLSMR